jgi:DNA-binding NarL/FixJ family response regulator
VNRNTDVSIPKRHRVAVLASDPITEAGLTALLRCRDEFDVLPPHDETAADVVVVAQESVSAGCLAALRDIAARTSARLVVILRDHCDVHLFTAVEYGVASVLLLGQITSERLTCAITTVAAGGVQFPEDIQAQLVAQIRHVHRNVLEQHGLNAHGLNHREMDVLRLVANGFGLREVASKMSCSERTVKSVLHAATSRLGMGSRIEAVAYASRVGIV